MARWLNHVRFGREYATCCRSWRDSLAHSLGILHAHLPFAIRDLNGLVRSPGELPPGTRENLEQSVQAFLRLSQGVRAALLLPTSDSLSPERWHDFAFPLAEEFRRVMGRATPTGAVGIGG